MYQFKLTDPHFLPHMACQVDLKIDPGELLILVGENGIGKTTLVSKLFVENDSLFAFLEQKPLDVFYDRTLKEIKKIILELDKRIFDHDAFLRYWSLFKFNEKDSRFHSSLSGGESQALKLCLTIPVLRPLLILDEPSQYLDDFSKSKLSEVIHELIMSGKGIILIEHDLNWITSEGTVIKLISENGQLIEGERWII